MTVRRGASSGVVVWIALLAVLTLAVTTRSASATEPEPSFCGRQTLRDYLAPLKRMPKLRERPYRARSEPFFRDVRIGSSGPSLSIGGGSSAGYQLQWDGNPRWSIKVTFAQVNGRGSVIRPMGTRRSLLVRQEFGGLVEPRIYLPRRPGFYRATMLIRSDSGRRLATFGNYYRVIEPKPDARLVTDSPSYQPGSTLFARVENPGAATVLTGAEFKIEQLTGSTWAPASAASGVFPGPLHWFAAGTAGGVCTSFPIPTSMPAGRYRVAQEAVITWAAQKTERRPFLYAEFEVVAPAG
jgi:hypothetical protein